MVFNFFKKELIEVIQCPEQNDHTLAWRFPVADQEIKNGASLTVREGQLAVFVNEGQLADVFKPGRYSLVTQNLPLLTTLKAWRSGFESPFKADVIFISTREMRQAKWGTPQPIVIRDSDFGMVRVRAYGSYGFKVIDAKDFIKNCTGIRSEYSHRQIEETIRRVVISKFTDALAEMKVGAVDVATKYDELGEVVLQNIRRSFDDFGIEVTDFVIESVNLPEEIQKAIDEQSKMNLMMNSQQKFAQWQVLKSMPDAMKSDGGSTPFQNLASDMAIGNAMGQMVGQAMNSAMPQQSQGQPEQPQGTAPQGQTGQSQQGASGASADTKFCQECGTKTPKSAKFCSHCGFKF